MTITPKLNIHNNYYDCNWELINRNFIITYCSCNKFAVTNPCVSSPCLSGGICTSQQDVQLMMYTCTCPSGRTGKNCQTG